MAVRKLLSLALAGSLAVGLAACGNGEDRPGQVTSENKPGSVSGTGSGSASGTGSASHAHEDTKDQFDRAQATTTLEVEAKDYAWGNIPATVKGPNVLFNVRNTGSAEHELEVVGSDGEPVGQTAAFKRNQSKSLAIKLAPGQYTAQCLVKEGAKTHAELGMKQTFTVE